LKTLEAKNRRDVTNLDAEIKQLQDDLQAAVDEKEQLKNQKASVNEGNMNELK